MKRWVIPQVDTCSKSKNSKHSIIDLLITQFSGRCSGRIRRPFSDGGVGLKGQGSDEINVNINLRFNRGYHSSDVIRTPYLCPSSFPSSGRAKVRGTDTRYMRIVTIIILHHKDRCMISSLTIGSETPHSLCTYNT